MSEDFRDQLDRLSLMSAFSTLTLGDSVKSIKIDVGCSSGHLMCQWLEADEGLFAVGVEPNPNSVDAARKLLSERFGPEGIRWVILNGALGSSSGHMRLFVPNNSPDQGSLLHPDSAGEVPSFKVRVERLSDLLSNLLSGRIDAVDFLKTDCQGLDLEVLKSGGEQLRQVKVITSEADSEGYIGATNSIASMSKYLTSLGFSHINKRSKLRRAVGKFLATITFGPELGLRLPNLSKDRTLGRKGIETQDPTFVNLRFADEVRAGRVVAFQAG